MVGYSGTPLDRKLGIKPGMALAILGAPAGYAKTLGKLPPGVTTGTTLRKDMAFVHFFTSSKAELTRRMPALVKAIAPSGRIWISWPKKSSKVPSDLSENDIRDIALANGVVDVKVCAVDETWSGLMLVRRTADR